MTPEAKQLLDIARAALEAVHSQSDGDALRNALAVYLSTEPDLVKCPACGSCWAPPDTIDYWHAQDTLGDLQDQASWCGSDD